MKLKLAILALFTAVPFVSAAGPVVDPATAKADAASPNLLWYDIRPLGVEGQGWTDTKAPYDRLPAKAEKTVRSSVWNLSRHSAGECVRFVTDAGASGIGVRWSVTKPELAMPHMAATGVSGVDLYARADDGKWRWVACGRPAAQTTTTTLGTGMKPGEREYMLYLPLYNGVSSVEIGIPKSATLKKADPRPEAKRKPVVFYGTSITHGACASRPGMVHTAILGRKLDVPVINLGFSGNGKLEQNVGDLLAELDPSVFVLDCLPNLTPPEVAERAEPFVRALRKAKPDVPIVMVEDRTYGNSWIIPAQMKRNVESRIEFKKAYDKLAAEKLSGLYYLEGANLIGDDDEATVDSSHPTDLGFVRQADAFAKVLAPLLK